MQKFQILYLFILGIFLTTFLVGCSKKEKEVIKIGVTISNFEDKFLSYLKQGMEGYETCLEEKVEVTYLDAKMDQKKQEEHIKYFIENDMDTVITIPVETKEFPRITEIIKKAEIPFIFGDIFTDELRKKELPKNVYLVGYDQKTAGVIQMEYLAEKLNGKGNVAILMGDFSKQGTFDRTSGVEETADKYSGINIVEKQSAKWLRPLATSIVEDWLNSGEKFDAIAANNDEMAIGAIRALEKHGKSGETMVVGVDATKEAISELEAGLLTGTVFQDYNALGKGLLDIAIKTAKGEKVKNVTWIQLQLVTPEDYKEVTKTPNKCTINP